MSAIDQLFTQLRSSGRKAFMPFVTAGDPDLEFTARVLRQLVDSGASICEVGIPYSDPIADGPVIQASYTRALDRGVAVRDIFKTLSKTTPTLAAPVVTMVSYAIVYRYGLAAYVEEAQEAGVAGAIVPDLPVEEAGELAEICRAADFSLIQLVTPTTPRERAVRIAESSSGFLYYVSVTGITGERTELPSDLVDNVAWLRGRTDLPICIGFGISRPEHARLLAPVADGLIVGSAIVRRIAEVAEKSPDDVLREVGEMTVEMVAAMNE
ncbi:MAG: tryptophan synthase subunit alpha [Planctomycetes bacterium]|nr:tryptophan synthase subunit alpha [Planctomycetota bacterium]